MRAVLTIAFCLAGIALAQEPQPSFTAASSDSYTKISAGPDILSIEETARSYFEEIVDREERHPSVDDPFNPKNFLRERDGLNETEISEVLAVARRMAAPESPNSRQAANLEDTEQKKAGCKALNRATTPDAQLAVLEAGEADAVARRAQKGNAHLAELSPVTRAHLRKVLVEYRKMITVGRQDWKKVRDTNPEALEMYRAAACNNAN